MNALIPFLILIAAGLFFSEIFKKLDLPYVIALIAAGILIGPVLNLIVVDETIAFLGSIGIVFLMFIAGSEIKLDIFKEVGNKIYFVAFLNAILPFCVGFLIGHLFGFTIYTSLVLGIVFISSSIAVIVPTLERNYMLNSRIGQTIISATVFEDIASLLLLGFVLQRFTQKTPLPLFIFIPLVIGILILLKLFIPMLGKKMFSGKVEDDLFQTKLRYLFVVLVAVVILFEILGMHAILAGFIIGMFLGDIVHGKVEEKIRIISYGFFIPIFFLVIGMRTDIFALTSLSNAILAIFVVVGLMSSKIISGWIGGRILNFSNEKSLLFGVSTTPQLSTTLAAAYAALEFGILNDELISALVLLSVVTVFVAPILMNIIIKRIPKKEEITSQAPSEL